MCVYFLAAAFFAVLRALGVAFLAALLGVAFLAADLGVFTAAFLAVLAFLVADFFTCGVLLWCVCVCGRGSGGWT